MSRTEAALAFAGRLVPSLLLGSGTVVLLSFGVREPGFDAATLAAAICAAIGAGGRLARLSRAATIHGAVRRPFPARFAGLLLGAAIILVVGLAAAAGAKYGPGSLSLPARWTVAGLLTGAMWICLEAVMCLAVFRRPTKVWKVVQGERLRGLKGQPLRPLALGAGCLLLGTGLALIALRSNDPPDSPQPVVGLATPAAHDRLPGGYVAAVQVATTDCSNPVRVRVSIEFPQEFWRGARPVPPVSVLSLAATGPGISDVEVEASFGEGRLRPRVLVRPDASMFLDQPIMVAMRPTLGWGRFASVTTVSFDADWIEDRGLGSCWLRLPELVGPRAFEAGEVASKLTNLALPNPRRWREIEPRQLGGTQISISRGAEGERVARRYEFRGFVNEAAIPAFGATQLLTPQHLVAGESHPAPSNPAQPVWQCDARSAASIASFGTALPVSSPAQTLRTYRATLGSDSNCSAWVALEDPGAQLWANLLLIVAGATISLGATLLVGIYLRRNGHVSPGL